MTRFFFAALLFSLLLASFTPATPLNSALNWLQANQNANGGFGGANCWDAICTPFPLLALNRSSTNTTAIASGLTFIQADLQNPASWTWGEADAPGLELYAVARLANASQLNASASSRLLSLQRQGFIGFYEQNATRDWNQVESTVDTALAVRGLRAADALNASNASAALTFLRSTQNLDGSFNLTHRTAFSPLYSLGPDTPSLTALTLLAFHDEGIESNDSAASSALTYLRLASASCFGGANHSYAASLAALAFNAYGDDLFASAAAARVVELQNPDGGWSDAARTSPASNPLDTGAAALALSLVNASNASCTPAPTPPSLSLKPVLLLPGREVSVVLDAPGAVSVYGNVSLPNASVDALAFAASNASFTATLNDTALLGAYNVSVLVGYANTSNASLAATFSVVNAFCGDGACDGSETCSSCPTDCGSCPVEPRVTVRVTFPPASGRSNAEGSFALSTCPTAYACFTQLVSLDCSFSTQFACPELGSPQACFVNAVNGVAAVYSQGSAYWEFLVNGAPASVGISCYASTAGSTLELRYTGPYATPLPASPSTPTPALVLPVPLPSVSSTPRASLTPTPLPTPSPSPSPSPEAFRRNPVTLVSPVSAASRPQIFAPSPSPQAVLTYWPVAGWSKGEDFVVFAGLFVFVFAVSFAFARWFNPPRVP